MRNDAVMQQEQRREAARMAERGVSRTAERDCEHQLRQDAAESREVMTAASREVDRRGDNVVEDARDGFGPGAGDAAKQWLDTARQVMDQAQQAASAFFRTLEAGLQAGQDQQRLSEMSERTASALQDFAAAMDRQSDELTRIVSEALDNQREVGAREAIDRSAEETERLKDGFDQEMRRRQEQFEGARAETERREEERQRLDAAQRRDQEERERDQRERQ
jgi:hypothetical protein